MFGEMPIPKQSKPNFLTRLIVRIKVAYRLWEERQEIKRAAEQAIKDAQSRQRAMR